MLKVYSPVIWLVGTFILISSYSYSQNDSLSYTKEYTRDSAIAYLTPMEYAFMFHEETKWLIKTNMMIAADYSASVNLKLSLEKKISKTLSLNAVLFNYTSFNLGLSTFGYDNYGLEFSLESRWYYKKRKSIRNNKPVANLSGAYLALGAGYRIAYTSTSRETNYSNLKFIPLYAKWGVQRRFLKRGYVDVGLMVGWNNSLTAAKWSTLFFSTYVDAGLAFTRDKQELDFDKLCPILRCHAADRFVLKTNLVNIINLAYVRKSIVGSVVPNIAAEFKLGTSPFSINTTLKSKFQYSKDSEHDFSSLSASPQFTIEGRYYYNLNRRILKGKTGNGLSANYISVGANYRGTFYEYLSGGNTINQRSSFVGLVVGTGIQRLISDHLYLDLNLGFTYGIQYSYDGYTRMTRNNTRSFLDIGFGIGYRF